MIIFSFEKIYREIECLESWFKATEVIDGGNDARFRGN
jgi:hypothetical protein